MATAATALQLTAGRSGQYEIGGRHDKHAASVHLRPRRLRRPDLVRRAGLLPHRSSRHEINQYTTTGSRTRPWPGSRPRTTGTAGQPERVPPQADPRGESSARMLNYPLTVHVRAPDEAAARPARPTSLTATRRSRSTCGPPRTHPALQARSRSMPRGPRSSRARRRPCASSRLRAGRHQPRGRRRHPAADTDAGRGHPWPRTASADGEQEKLIADGATEIGGPMPVNTDGGLIANGEPIGASTP